MAVMQSIIYFIIAIAILIAVHEWGHFIVARMVGVKVLRFAIGFGKPILRYQGKKGTEYVLALCPLGGYVKMLDEEEESVKQEELDQAFNRKPVWARMAVVVAGPALNILFAIFALWLMFTIGISTMAPIVGKVQQNSIAAKAELKKQDEILAIDKHSINSWRDFQLNLVSYMGGEKSADLSVVNLETKQKRILSLPLKGWQLAHEEPDVIKSLGIKPYTPLLDPVVGKVLPDSAGEASGVKAGDKILAIDGKQIKYWYEVVLYVQKHANKKIELTVLRGKKRINFNILAKTKIVNNKKIGFIGIAVKQQYLAAKWIRKEQYSPLVALKMAWAETKDLTVLSVEMIWKFITGKVSLRNIGGPIGVAQGASQSAQIGLAYYLSFLALVSVSLGVLNILPVPMLDGGHLLFYVIELIIGRPIKKNTREKSMVIGLILMLGLTILAVFNDVTRLMN